MAFDLTLTGTPAYSAGKFGQALTGGAGYSATDPVTSYPFTIQQWVKANASGNIEVAGGRASWGWFGKAANNTALAHYGPGSAGTGDGNDITLASTVNLADGARHLLELVVTVNGGTFFVDGIIQSSSLAKPAAITQAGQKYGVRAFFGTTSPTFPWTGEVDQFAVFNTALHTENYSVPTTALAGNEPGLVALYQFEGTGANSAGVVAGATALTLTGPSTGTVGAASGAFTVGANGSITGTVAVTPNDGSAGGTFEPSSVNISSASPSATFTYAAASAGAKSISLSNNGGLTNPAAVTTTASAPVVNSYDPAKIVFSPYNWDVQAGFAKTINAGAYLRMNFTGASCALAFDLAAAQTPYPKLSYRIDGFGPWTTVDLAASVAISIPSELAAYPAHQLELMVRSTTESRSRWVSQATGVKLTGITLANGGVLSKPAEQPLYGLYFGDSITEGINTIASTGDTTVRSDAAQGWAYLSARMLGAECGIVGFGRQGLTVTGNPDVPVFGSTWNQLYAGVARSFARAPDYIVINQGTNDGSANIQSAALAVMNNILAAMPASTKIVVLRPFNGAGDAYWRAAIAACAAPARISYIDTTGWFVTANSPDGLHPNGYANISRIAPLATSAIKSVLDGNVPTAARTVSFTLGDASGALANLSGLQVSFFDEPTPDQHTVARFKTANETTDAAGSLSFSVQSTLAVGGSGSVVVRLSDGRNLVRTVTVA
jgi:hypothetical protein